MMPLWRRPSSTLLLLLIALVVLILCPVGASAQAVRSEYGTVIGIDLGTTNFRVAVYNDRRLRVETIVDDWGNHAVPAWISFGEAEVLIGPSAKAAFSANPKNIVFDIMKLIGRNMDDAGIIDGNEKWAFEAISETGALSVGVEFRREPQNFTPVKLLAMLLGKAKETAQAYLGEEVTNAVVAVPTYFAASQLQAIHDAGAISELNILRTVGEPMLAAVAHGLDLKGGHQRVLVYDLGGSTFDVTLLSIEDSVFDILSTRSDIHLGGHDFDQRVVDFFAGLYNTKTGTHVMSNPRAMVKLRRAVEQAKHALSSQHMARIVTESFENGGDWAETLTRATFEELNMDLFRETLRMVDQVLEDGGVAKEEVDQVILAGGSARIPKIQQLMGDYFNRDMARFIDSEEVVVQGAALQGRTLSCKEPLVKGRCNEFHGCVNHGHGKPVEVRLSRHLTDVMAFESG